jgi:urease accessory protein
MRIEAHQLLLLLNWMSPAFPTGAFAYSHGLEWAIDAGQVTDAGALKGWISDLVTRGSGWNDAVLFARCFEDEPAELNVLALALATSKERFLETTQLGRSFGTAASVFHGPQLSSSRRKPGPPDQLQRTIQPAENIQWVPACAGMTEKRVSFAGEKDIAYPIAAGMACAAMGIAKHHALLAYLQGFCAALTSVAVRLVPLGQTAGLGVLRNLMPVIAEAAERAATATLGDLGAITISADIAAMKHETQTSRVFRT